MHKKLLHYNNSYHDDFLIAENKFYTISESGKLTNAKNLVQTESFQIKKFAYHKNCLCLLSGSGQFVIFRIDEPEKRKEWLLENSVVKKEKIKDFSLLESMSDISIVNGTF